MKPRAIPDDFAEQAKVKCFYQLSSHYNAGSNTVRRWAKVCGIVAAKTQPRIEAPADFAEMYNTLPSQKALASHYRTTCARIRSWMKQSDIVPRPQSPPPAKLRPIPDDFAQVAPHLSRYAISRHYRTEYKVVDRWLRESGVKPGQRQHSFGTPRMTLAPSRGTGKPMLAITRTTSIYDDAADILRRFAPVNRCNENGKYQQAGDFWRYGQIRLTPDELLERAARKRAA